MNALEKINMAILLATISYVIAIDTVLAGFSDLPTQMRWFITFLTSVGLFRILIVLVYWVITSSNALLALYHRGRFLKGLWTYAYDVDGKRHVGIWRVSQDLASISITGYGFDGNGAIDSRFRGISQIFAHQGVDEIMFARTDARSDSEHFSKTSLYIDGTSRSSLVSGPKLMRAHSILYGFEEDGARQADIVLKKAPAGKSEAEIVEELRGSSEREVGLDAGNPT
ncbi:MAG: hypothetical protein ACE37E_16550 [Hyphomicrobiales bacterium]